MPRADAQASHGVGRNQQQCPQHGGEGDDQAVVVADQQARQMGRNQADEGDDAMKGSDHGDGERRPDQAGDAKDVDTDAQSSGRFITGIERIEIQRMIMKTTEAGTITALASAIWRQLDRATSPNVQNTAVASSVSLARYCNRIMAE